MGKYVNGPKTCEKCGKYSTDDQTAMWRHKKECGRTEDFKCKECDYTTPSWSAFSQHVHMRCSICGEEGNGVTFQANHIEKHPTPGQSKYLYSTLFHLRFLEYSFVLERVFDGDQNVLSVGRRLAAEVEKEFGASTSGQDSHFNQYSILFPFREAPKGLKEFVAGHWYEGRGQKIRLYTHSLKNETVTSFLLD
jgi:hypothetical protein